MQGWFVVVAVDHRRIAPGGHVYDTLFDTLSVGTRPPAAVLQSDGDVGGMLMAGALLLVLGLTAVAVWQGRAGTLFDGLFGRSDAAEQSTVETAERESTDATPGGTDSATTESTTESDAAELTDKEVIVDILEDNEGRMKQARIVDSTGWSKSKVSMLLSEMEDDGDITKLRVGRENIISLSGNEPDAAGSPFDSQ